MKRAVRSHGGSTPWHGPSASSRAGRLPRLLLNKCQPRRISDGGLPEPVDQLGRNLSGPGVRPADAGLSFLTGLSYCARRPHLLLDMCQARRSSASGLHEPVVELGREFFRQVLFPAL